MAKKPMKFKRYEEGGDVEESKAKQRGLDISNKEEPVGFLQRLRMGNIDDPTSEAYKRFGAGRGRSEAPAKQEEAAPAPAPMPVARPSMKPNPIFAAGEAQGMRQPSGDASVAEDYSGPRTKPIVTASASKPSASKPVAPKPAKSPEPKVTDTGDESSRLLTKYKKSEESSAPVDETKLSLSERMKLSRARNKAGSGPTDKRSVNERIREKLGFKKGGSVSSASRRADGIATKGKTRGKIC